MSLMLPAYGLYGFAYYWPSWVHLLVIALMVVAGSLTLKALAARIMAQARAIAPCISSLTRVRPL